MSKTCEQCGSEFRARWGKPNRYCSMPCYRLGARRRVNKTCANCGETFEVRTFQLTIPNHGRFCSKSCASSGEHSEGWKGGRYVELSGYVRVLQHGHPHANENGYVLEHRLVAERAIGKILRRSAPVHHINRDPSDNRPSNLVICDSHGYHKMLHTKEDRLAALARAGGNPETDKVCCKCKQAKPKSDFHRFSSTHDGLAARCKPCVREISAQQAIKRKQKELRALSAAYRARKAQSGGSE